MWIEWKLFVFLFYFILVSIKTSSYWFHRQALLKKAKEIYNNGDKGKAVEYSQANKYVIKQKSHNQ